jgi:hypothetical protein
MTVAGAKLYLLDLLKTIIQNIANINNIYIYIICTLNFPGSYIRFGLMNTKMKKIYTSLLENLIEKL